MSAKTDKEVAKVDYPKLPPRPFGSLSPGEYIDQRLNQALSWYDTKSLTCKNRYLRIHAFSVAGAALVPVLVNIEFPYVDPLATVISILVVLLVSL